MRLADKIIIVTGTGSGFDKGTANTPTREDVRAVANDLNAEAGERAVSAIHVAGGDTYFVQANVSNGDSVAKLLGATLACYDDLYIVVNNVDTTHKNKSLLQITKDGFDHVMAANAKSTYWTAHHIVPHLREHDDGVFANAASIVGIRPRSGSVWYNVGKDAVITVSRVMATELGLDKIRVNCVNSVVGTTGPIEQFMGVPDTPENRARFLATIPMERLSTPQNVTNVCLCLTSGEARFITNACLEADGGRYI